MHNQSINSVPSGNQNSETSTSGLVNYPTRNHNEKQPIVRGGYVFALIVAMILGFQSLEASYERVNGQENISFATKSAPSSLLVSGLTLIGLGLGIEIDKSTIFSKGKGIIQLLVNSSMDEED
ncbi:hypothetical protein BJP36_32745 [Moorena producens JHB]|uniref:DUF1385 domain-containing protein n=1 Tax=Moorena producens (strain JHB) TaxID=1454205 RepID=A0A1D9G8M9_MOOP1|nr:hypothetical protein [Moorena producens]AOY83987.1 hypothetical protein BJP36_32745 [Moorena producens JHB]